MKKTLLLSVLLVASFGVCAQTLRTYEDHWRATYISFDRVIYGDINDFTCNRDLRNFRSCLYALNKGLNLLDEKNVYFLLPKNHSKDPLIGFSAKKVPIDDPDLNEKIIAYENDIENYFKEIEKIPYISLRAPFKHATSELEDMVRSTNKESYFTALIYNAYLSEKYDPHTYIIPATLISQESSLPLLFGFEYMVIDYKQTKKILFTKIHKSSPAARAGIEPGDIIIEANGKSNLREIESEILSDKLILSLEGSSGPRTVSLSRGLVAVPNIVAEQIKKGNRSYGLIKLNSFLDEQACRRIEAHGLLLLDKKVDGIILDLRGNGGGAVNQAICINGLFLKKGSYTFIIKELATNKVQGVKQQTESRIFKDIHTVTLIDGMSASASEIVSIYLQAYRKSWIVGEKSFGKGTMQRLNNFNNNDLVLMGKTLAKFYGPHQVSPQLQGVVPDFEIFPKYEQKTPTPFKRERDLYSNAIVNQEKQFPVMQERREEIVNIKECMNQNQSIKNDFETLDSFKKRVFDQQLSAATAVIDCADDLRLPVFDDINIPTEKID